MLGHPTNVPFPPFHRSFLVIFMQAVCLNKDPIIFTRHLCLRVSIEFSVSFVLHIPSFESTVLGLCLLHWLPSGIPIHDAEVHNAHGLRSFQPLHAPPYSNVSGAPSTGSQVPAHTGTGSAPVFIPTIPKRQGSAGFATSEPIAAASTQPDVQLAVQASTGDSRWKRKEILRPLILSIPNPD